MKAASQVRRGHWIVATLALVSAAAVPQLAAAQPPAAKEVYTLKELIQRALASSPEDRKSTRLNSSHSDRSRMPSSA